MRNCQEFYFAFMMASFATQVQETITLEAQESANAALNNGQSFSVVVVTANRL